LKTEEQRVSKPIEAIKKQDDQKLGIVSNSKMEEKKNPYSKFSNAWEEVLQ
jgi:hypothetical protein